MSQRISNVSLIFSFPIACGSSRNDNQSSHSNGKLPKFVIEAIWYDGKRKYKFWMYHSETRSGNQWLLTVKVIKVPKYLLKGLKKYQTLDLLSIVTRSKKAKCQALMLGNCSQLQKQISRMEKSRFCIPLTNFCRLEAKAAPALLHFWWQWDQLIVSSANLVVWLCWYFSFTRQSISNF